MRHDREPFEGGSYDESEAEDLGAELLEGDMDYSHAGADAFSDYIGDVGRDPFAGAQLND